MKKMIMAAAIVCAATFAHAAAMTWGISAIEATPDGTAAKAGMIAYFLDGSTYSDFSALSSDKIGAYVSGKALYSTQTTAGRGGVINASSTDGTYNAGEKVGGYMVIFNSGDVSTASYYASTAFETLSVPASGDLKYARDFKTMTSGWQKIESVTPGPTPGGVPEPTSGLLLVLGGAALALRRRR